MDKRISTTLSGIHELIIHPVQDNDIVIKLRWRLGDQDETATSEDMIKEWAEWVKSKLPNYIENKCTQFGDLSEMSSIEICANLWFDYYHLPVLQKYGIVLVEIMVE